MIMQPWVVVEERGKVGPFVPFVAVFRHIYNSGSSMEQVS